MSGHLCLKWNNHSSAFLKSISNIQIKERYCDATIACQGRYFPVHRVVLSTCSDYFDEMFERMQCQHPYIVFKDIEPREMELLLNYMYQGEVNVVQEMLPTLIKAAEALKVKGLAVPDDLPAARESSGGKKRSSTSNDSSQPKRRSEENKRRRREDSTENLTNHSENLSTLDTSEPRIIKGEPIDTGEYGGQSTDFEDGALPAEAPDHLPLPNESLNNKDGGIFVGFPGSDEPSTYIKSEEGLQPQEEHFEEQSSSWSDFGGGSVLPNPPPSEMTRQDDMFENDQLLRSSLTFENNERNLGNTTNNRSKSGFRCPYCPYESTTKYCIDSHLKFKHLKEKPYSCNFCTYRSTLKKDMFRHMRTHTGERPYECPHCSLRFSHKTSLTAHLNKKNACFQLSHPPE